MREYDHVPALCQGFVKQANLMRAQARQLMAQGERDAADQMQERAEQFLAFAMGYMTHVATDTVAHSFVNAQCGGPYRDHPQRHHLIENHIDCLSDDDKWRHVFLSAGWLHPGAAHAAWRAA